jgi:hypothetical protein
LSHGRGERALNDLLATSCKVVEALGDQHAALADQLADKLSAVAHVVARKVQRPSLIIFFIFISWTLTNCRRMRWQT